MLGAALGASCGRGITGAVIVLPMRNWVYSLLDMYEGGDGSLVPSMEEAPNRQTLLRAAHGNAPVRVGRLPRGHADCGSM